MNDKWKKYIFMRLFTKNVLSPDMEKSYNLNWGETIII